jgi:hypothetical protein
MIRALAEELKPVATDPGQFLSKLNSDLHAILKHTGTPMLTNKDSIDRSARAWDVSMEVRRRRARGASMLSGVERARRTRLVFCF